MNAPVSPHHLTPELHQALGTVTLDESTPHGVLLRRLTCAQRKLGRSYKHKTGVLLRRLTCAQRKLGRSYKYPGAAGGFGVERGVR